MKTALLILETSDIGCRYTADAARELGFDPIFIADLRNYQADTLRQLNEETVIDVPTVDAAAIQDRLSQLNLPPISGVLTFLDSRLGVATQLSRLLGVPGHDPHCDALKDKFWVQTLVPEYSPMSIRIFEEPSRQEISGLLNHSSAESFVLKPTDTAGAIGFKELLREEVAVENILHHMASAPISAHLRPDSWILQEKIEGRLASVEGYVTQGEVRFIGLSGREKIENTESQIHFPAQDSVHPLAWATAKDCVRALVSRSGFENGYFHIEFIFRGIDAYLIDANMGRLGGGPIGEVLASAFSIPVSRVFRHVIVTTLNLPEASPYPPLPVDRQILGICYGIENAARLDTVHLGTLEQSEIHHTQILAAGSEVPKMGTNNWAWVGIATGERTAILPVLKRLRIATSEGLQEACF